MRRSGGPVPPPRVRAALDLVRRLPRHLLGRSGDGGAGHTGGADDTGGHPGGAVRTGGHTAGYRTDGDRFGVAIRRIPPRDRAIAGGIGLAAVAAVAALTGLPVLPTVACVVVVGAAAVVAHRTWVRRTYAPEAYDSGWAQEGGIGDPAAVPGRPGSSGGAGSDSARSAYSEAAPSDMARSPVPEAMPPATAPSGGTGSPDTASPDTGSPEAGPPGSGRSATVPAEAVPDAGPSASASSAPSPSAAAPSGPAPPPAIRSSDTAPPRVSTAPPLSRGDDGNGAAAADLRRAERSSSGFPPAFGAASERAGFPAIGRRAYGISSGAADGRRDRRRGRRDGTEPPDVSVEAALAELDEMVGLEQVKEQIRAIAASLEAARLRARAGMPADTPLRHFVFTGPPGTGKTAVARIIAKIFAASGMLATSDVVEAQRTDLVGDHLGATALKTNHLVDRALGGLLYVDGADELVHAREGQPDRFGDEAVRTLLKRADDDRDRLVIVLSGDGPRMEEFLSSKPGLSARFGTRIRFPGYRPPELVEIAELFADRRGDRFAAAALPVLRRGLDDLDRRGVLDELGNGRFVRSLVEAAARARDVRVVGIGGGADAAAGGGTDPSPDDLVTVRADDVQQALAEVTERYRGDVETPTLEEALASLDRLVGLEPVKQQVRAIAAQLRVARLRQEQGLPAQPPMRHFVFAGPPGTGKTTVARVLGRVFAALGLLPRPDVVEAQRADLVGEHLGSTALKTNRLIDAALGGVLFIDEAYALHNPGYAGGDAFGAEAVQTLLKRAEDDRDRLVIVLAGYPAHMDRFLASNPGLASRFAVRVAFPSYGPDELLRLAELIAEEAGDRWEPEALDDLAGVFQRVCGRNLIDELGNGRFVRSLYEKACAARDVRVAELGASATTAQLTTVTRADASAAARELIPVSPRRP